MAIPFDCTAPAILDWFKGDAARCKLVVACQTRVAQAGVPIPPDIKAACDKTLADWDASERARAAAITKPQEDEIRSLLKK